MTPKIFVVVGIILLGCPGYTWCSTSKVKVLDSLAEAATNKSIRMLLNEEEMLCARQEIQMQSEYNAQVVGKRIGSKSRIVKIGGWTVLYKASTYKIPGKHFSISYEPDSLYMWKIFVKHADSIIVDLKSRKYPAWVGLEYSYSEQTFEVAHGFRKKGEKTWVPVNVKRVPKNLEFEICSTQPVDAVIAPMEVFFARPEKTYRTLIMPNYRMHDGADGDQVKVAHNRYGGLTVRAEHNDSSKDSLHVFIENDTLMEIGIGKVKKCLSINGLDSLCFEHKTNENKYAE